MELSITLARKTFDGVDGEPDFELLIDPLALDFGTVTYLMGHNGSGKSVYLKLLTGELSPDKEPILLSFDASRDMAGSKSAAIVRQRADDSLALDLTVSENLRLRYLGTNRFDHISGIERHSELLKKLHQPARDLSQGQRQFLAFACATQAKRPLLLLDEFLASADQTVSRHLSQDAKAYAKGTPACVLIVSHDLPAAIALADRILVLRMGKLVKDVRRDRTQWNEASLSSLLANPGVSDDESSTSPKS